METSSAKRESRGHAAGVSFDPATEADAGLDRAAQAEDRLAHVDVDRPRGRAELGHLRARLVDAAAREVLVDRERLRVDVAEHLRDPVVQLAGDALAFLDNRQLAEPSFETVVFERDGRLVGERGERLDLVGVEAARCARADRKQPDRRAAAAEWGREADDGGP